MKPVAVKSMLRRTILFVVIFSASGCFSLGRNAPLPSYFVLDGRGVRYVTLASEPSVGERSGVPLVGLRPIRMADYLATPFIVIRRGEHQIEFSQHHRWGEDLGRAITRNLSAHLAYAVAPRAVEAAPWPSGTAPEFLLQLHILRFEGVVGAEPGPDVGTVHLVARWEIERAEDGGVWRGNTEVRKPGWVVGDFEALVGLLEDTLRTLAEDLIRSLGQGG
jgi:uncharacterized lipoprotein YmbA